MPTTAMLHWPTTDGFRLPGWPEGVALSENLPLHMESKKLALRFIGSLPIERIISHRAVRLSLSDVMKILATFPMSRIKPVHDSHPNPAPPFHPLLHLIYGSLAPCPPSALRTSYLSLVSPLSTHLFLLTLLDAQFCLIINY